MDNKIVYGLKYVRNVYLLKNFINEIGEIVLNQQT